MIERVESQSPPPDMAAIYNQYNIASQTACDEGLRAIQWMTGPLLAGGAVTALTLAVPESVSVPVRALSTLTMIGGLGLAYPHLQNAVGALWEMRRLEEIINAESGRTKLAQCLDILARPPDPAVTRVIEQTLALNTAQGHLRLKPPEAVQPKEYTGRLLPGQVASDPLDGLDENQLRDVVTITRAADILEMQLTLPSARARTDGDLKRLMIVRELNALIRAGNLEQMAGAVILHLFDTAMRTIPDEGSPPVLAALIDGAVGTIRTTIQKAAADDQIAALYRQTIINRAITLRSNIPLTVEMATARSFKRGRESLLDYTGPDYLLFLAQLAVSASTRLAPEARAALAQQLTELINLFIATDKPPQALASIWPELQSIITAAAEGETAGLTTPDRRLEEVRTTLFQLYKLAGSHLFLGAMGQKDKQLMTDLTQAIETAGNNLSLPDFVLLWLRRTMDGMKSSLGEDAILPPELEQVWNELRELYDIIHAAVYEEPGLPAMRLNPEDLPEIHGLRAIFETVPAGKLGLPGTDEIPLVAILDEGRTETVSLAGRQGEIIFENQQRRPVELTELRIYLGWMVERYTTAQRYAIAVIDRKGWELFRATGQWVWQRKPDHQLSGDEIVLFVTREKAWQWLMEGADPTRLSKPDFNLFAKRETEVHPKKTEALPDTAEKLAI